MVCNVSFGEKGKQIYESNEWFRGNSMTTIVVGLVWILYAILYVLLKVMTDYKLR